ncbi:MAG: hypothetical protein II819_00900 [Fibrobacter sp.]|nr:hypothetical protein [Fibrobacter sp.]
MNKKFLVGFSVLSVAAAAFWACGDGDVITKGGDDELALLNYGPPFAEGDEGNMKTLLNQAMADCAADEACAAKMEGAEYVPPESSAEGGEGGEGGDTPATGSSSSKAGPVINSSAASTTPVGSSASGGDNPPPSSATTVTDLNNLDGDCAPSVTSITKGNTVTWTLTPATPQVAITEVALIGDYKKRVNASTCEWTLEGAETTTVSGLCGDGVTATYNTASGGKALTAKVKFADKEKSCGGVKVNGKSVKGCVCTAPTTIDIAVDPVATWSVACSDASNDPIKGYTWDNNMGTSPTATYKFTAAKQTLTPKVSINTDESDTTITCSSPKVTDGNNPETNIDFSTAEPVEIAVGNTYTVKKCNTTTDNIKCDSNGGGHKLLVNGTAAWTSFDWMTGSGQYQAATKCSVEMTLEATGGNITCVNNW